MRTYKEEHCNRILEHNKNNLKYFWNLLNKSIRNGEKKIWLC